MSALSDWLEADLRSHLFRGTASQARASLVRAVALCTGATTDAHTGATIPEVANAGAYARTGPAAADANWSAPDAVGGLTDNVAAITFPTATAAWGTVSHIDVCDSATWGAGNSLVHGSLAASKSVGINDIFQFAAGALDIIFA